ncbi:MAG TPA: M20/M25/M40 family metallo-hydrolase [Gemmatimonadaceae bacterium]|nr:M20/M25/M40 family metallo-hydrolase [Gemmatimonadaceae bacterium]
MAALCVVATSATAQVTETVSDWIALDAPPGQEGGATQIISASLPGWTPDALGNLVKRVGSGSPRRVVACGLDDGGYIVSEITDAGYLRLAAPERSRHSPLWDQFHEGQRVRVLTKNGALPGVIAVKSTHLWRRRSTPEVPVTIDDLWLDVGARSRAEVAQMGIAILDPVAKQWAPWRYGEYVAGPEAAARASCAVVAGAASAKPTQGGETIFVLAVQHSFARTGLQSVLSRLGRVDTLVLVEPGLTPADTMFAVMRADVAATPRVGTTIAIGVRARYPGTLVESLRAGDITALAGAVAQSAGVASAAPAALHGVPTVPPAAPPTADSLTPVADLLTQVSTVYGPSGHEADVRRTVRGLIPRAWNVLGPAVDTAGNLFVVAGPPKDTVVFVAHLDELGFDIVRIEHDGRVVLKPLGGFYPSLWEGQRALLHEVTKCDTPMRGVFIPRDKATVKQPDTVSAWFGVDSAALVACGVHVGQGVTSTKHPTRLGPTRYTVRALDDRTGVTSLLLAMQHIDPTKLDHTVIFAFSTREEVGLNGAAALAVEFGTSVQRVHAVDTFVSSDSPLESPRFAYAPIGAGAVERAHDNSSVTPAAEVERVRRIAESSHIPLQIGTTNGGNDGSEFVRYGAIDVPLAWPLRYSHSPAELIDLSDLHALGLLIAAVAVAPAK